MNEPSSSRVQLMSREEVERRVVETISANLCIETDGVRPSSSFQDLLASSFKELGADSLDLYSIMMDLEEELGVQIPDRQAKGFVTVADVVAFVFSHTPRLTSISDDPGHRKLKRKA